MTQPSLLNIKALLIDMDGVLWRGDTLLPGFKPLFSFLRSNNIPFMLATNNARKTKSEYVKRFARFGVTVSPDEVMSSSLATVIYLKAHFEAGAKIHVLGEAGIQQAVQEAGFELSDTEVVAVIAGLDISLTYDKLKTASLLINGGATFIGTNPDKTFPFEGGFAPGAGSILAAISAATGKEPVVIGKPGQVMYQAALQHLQTPPAQTAMLGDRLETDILGGQEAGMKTILVLSGVTQADELETSPIQPDWVFRGIDSLVEAWERGD